MTALRSLLADNPGPFTHEGTRSYILGHRRVAVLDPGPDLQSHVRAVVRSVEAAERVTVVLTHGHGDHAGAVDRLLEALPEVEVVGAGHPAARSLAGGDVVPTDAGGLVTVETPGHSRDHLCFHWPEGRALFAGDMVLGVGDTTWVAEYPGCVADYLASLTRLEALELERVHPAHGPDLKDVPGLWRRYRAHRERRISMVRAAMEGMAAVEARGGRAGGGPADTDSVTPETVLEAVYGDSIPDGLRGAALQSVGALMEYVSAHPGGAP